MVLTSRERRLNEINYDRRADFRKLSVAEAKYVLARTLGSRGDPPGPAGRIRTDHKELRQESKDEKKEIETKLARSLSSVPPVGYIG